MLLSTLTPSARSNALISAAQCRSARAILGWSVAKLASAASVRASAIDDFETERRAAPAVARRIRRAFEPVGILFLRDDDVACAGKHRSKSAATASASGDLTWTLRETL